MQNEFNLSKSIRFLSKEARSLWGKFSANDFELAKTKLADVKSVLRERMADPKVQARVDAFKTKVSTYKSSRKPSRDSEDEISGVKFNHTENSPLANGAVKADAVGIDSFGEKESFDPKEAVENQSYKDRKQNSDLAERYYTPGLQSDK